MDSVLFFGNIQKIITVNVDDRRIPVMVDALEIIVIILMNVSVAHVLRMIFIHHVKERRKARVRAVFVVAQIERGGMSQQDVDAAAPPELEAQTVDPHAHLPRYTG